MRDVSLTLTVRAALRLACCWGLLAISAWPQDVRSQTPIEYVAPDQSIWTTRTANNGEPDNPLKPVVAALLAKAAIPWTARTYPATRMFNMLRNGEAQFAILVRSPALEACCLLSRQPLVTAEIRAYRRIGTPPTPSRADLAGRSVITIRGYSYGGLGGFLSDPANHVTVHDTPTHAAAFRMLANGRADYLIDYAGPANEVLAAEPLAGVAFDVVSRQDVHLVLARSYPDAPRVMRRLEVIADTLDVPALMGGR